ncbi:MAG: DEAD/DEAH box helicase family protein [Acidimicrobiaceae bacterium]|nr:DEAD/DEAH box helicase family protein [Acidimicrobiaceae bacterium]
MTDLYPGSPASRGALPVLTEADDKIRTSSGDQSDGKWLEEVTVRALPHIRELDVADCWSWQDWPDKHRVLPGAPVHDWVGIDAVAQRRSDKRWVAIQVKARQLDADGTGNPVAAGELDKFLAGASNRDVWAERWLIVNGSVELGGHSPEKVAMSGAPVNPLNLAQLIQTQIHELTSSQSDASSLPPGEGASQNRAEMQKEAVEMAVARLRENELQDEDGIPKGEARGRIVLPCGAGKTRIALRIVERLTNTGELSVVLCPSIALVAQLRREFLNYAQAQLRTLAVCSDQTVSANEEQITQSDDLTADRGLVSTEVLRGCPVTTDPDVIAAWIKDRREGDASQMVSVIFSTYQSGARLAEAFKRSDAADAFKVLICDEAHRTAGVRRRKRSTALDDAVREFTLCHDRDAFPATYRVYQTATPRIYGDAAQAVAAKRADRSDFVVRHMDDQAVFGIELYRRSYHDAVTNGWLSDYRIIAMGISGKEAVDVANTLVREADEQAEFEAAEAEKGMTSKSRRKRGQELPTTGDYLKGMAFALAIGGGAVDPAGGRVPIKSCIGFLNTITRSKTMTTVLQSQAVRDWVAGQLPTPPPPRTSAAPHYRLEHLDASSPVARRDEAKRRLAAADAATPHSILNVGIFGEGTDSPSLSAVAFLEPRKSPIDVVQAVGRAMRRAQGKELGYIIVPVVIPEGADAETFLATSDKHEGWRELGDILQALRAHDQRIEDALPQMLTIQLPAEQPQLLELRTVVAVGRPERKQLEYAVVTGSHDDAEDTAREAVGTGRPLLDFDNTEPLDEGLWESPTDEPASVIVHVQRSDGSTVTSQDTVVRKTPKPHQDRGDINVNQTKRRAVEMAKGKRGARRPDPDERARRRQERDKARQARQAAFEASIQGVLVDLQSQIGDSISMNLLEKSGLTGNRITRDLNLLRNAVEEAARYLHQETGLAALLDSHFELDNLAAPKAGKQRADGATIAALLWMNAAMLHQRIHAGGWLGSRGIDSLESVKASSEPEEVLRDSWEVITRQDFLPVLEPALDALRTARRSGRLGGLRRALRHLAAEAERIAETYADMGADHAGALFNKVMGDQSSDGAFFTRPVAADIAARLALQAVDPDDSLDWSDSEVWRAHKTVDLACGSGTLLTAVMTEMKRRAERSGADLDQLADLQKLAAEDVLKGLDINPVSLQLAATQLMSGNRDIKYRRMGLHRMPYGPQPDGSSAAGTLELLARSEIIDSGRLFDDAADSDTIKTGAETDSLLKGPEMDDAAAAAANARIVIMNPPFTNRSKAGEKFDTDEQRSLRHRMDALEQMLVASDDRLNAVLDKNSIEPMFTTLAQCCLSVESGSSIALLAPTIKATAASNAAIRLLMAERLHVHTILTCHDPGSVNLSQNTAINESVFVFQRRDSDDDPPPPTRIIALDRLPTDSEETDDLFDAIAVCGTGALPDGWGEVSSWPAERIRAGDWSAAVWRSPALASAAAGFAAHDGLTAIQRERERERRIHKTEPMLSAGYRRSTAGAPGR